MLAGTRIAVYDVLEYLAGDNERPIETSAYARRHDDAVVSRDSDVNDLAFVRGPPPQVVWRRVGNAPTDTIAALVNTATDTIARFWTLRVSREVSADLDP